MVFHRASLIRFGCILLTLAPLVASAGESVKKLDDIPEISARSDSSSAVPVWVSSRIAFDSNGELRNDLFSSSARLILNGNRKVNGTGDCHTFLGAPPSEVFSADGSLDALVENALVVLKAEVLAGESGFYNGTPGTLYLLHTENLLKSFGRLSSRGPLLLFVPEATIRTAQGVICSRMFGPVPTPQTGDHIIAFITFDPLDEDRRILSVETGPHLAVAHAGCLFTPKPTEVLSDGRTAHYSTLHALESEIQTNSHVMDLPQRLRK